MRVLVTGATGFIGQHVVARLARQQRFEVITASRGHPDLSLPGIVHQSVDLLARGGAADLMARLKPTHLLHLAWNVAPGRFWADPNNLDWAAASLLLLRAFLDRGGQRAVMAGTCAEYDWTGEPLLTESSPIYPATFYGVVKDATRRVACAANDHLGASVAWGRVFWLYGPGEAPGRLISEVAAALARGRMAEVGEGLQARDFLHVDDVAGAFVAALESSWRGPFNIASGEGVPVRRLVEILARISGRPDLVRFGVRPTPSNDPPLIVGDTKILREEMGWTGTIPLEEGLRLTYEWWRSRLNSDGN